MMKKIILLLIFILAAGHCKGDKSHRLGEMADDPDLASQNRTKFVRAGDMHIAFDLMSMAYHERMMKLMDAPMKHVPGSTHGMMVTVLDYTSKRIIEHAQVSLKVVFPDETVRSFETEVMRGAGMLHYAIHLDASARGTYRFIARVTSKGKTKQAKAIFEL